MYKLISLIFLLNTTLYVMPCSAQSDLVQPSTDQLPKELRTNDEDLFKGTISKSTSLSTENLAKVLGASFANQSYPCRIEKIETPSLAKIAGLSAGDIIQKALMANNSLVMAVSRRGQVFRLTIEIPHQALTTTKPTTKTSIVPSHNKPSKLLVNPSAILSDELSITHIRIHRRTGCICMDDSWCREQCAKHASCNCPSMKTNPDLSCNWSGSGPDAERIRSQQTQFGQLHQQARGIQTERQQLEQKLLQQ